MLDAAERALGARWSIPNLWPFIGVKAPCAMIVTMAYDEDLANAESVSTKRALEPWAMQSVAFARALPPQEKK